jgi:predicted nucleotidyltransferase
MQQQQPFLNLSIDPKGDFENSQGPSTVSSQNVAHWHKPEKTKRAEYRMLQYLETSSRSAATFNSRKSLL